MLRVRQQHGARASCAGDGVGVAQRRRPERRETVAGVGSGASKRSSADTLTLNESCPICGQPVRGRELAVSGADRGRLEGAAGVVFGQLQNGRGAAGRRVIALCLCFGN